MAALVTAVVTVLSFFALRGDGDSAQPPDSNGRSTIPPEQESQDSESIAWLGLLRLRKQMWLDVIPPARGAGPPGMNHDLAQRNGRAIADTSVLAPWPDNSEPSRADCAKLTDEPGVESLPIEVGGRMCIRTDEGRLVYLTVLEQESDAWVTRLVVWRRPA